MAGPTSTATEKNGSSPDGFAAAAPQITLPKGGGAIRGIGEKFTANAVTGTGSLTVPIAVSPGRSGFGPTLSLSYDSGAGNGPFGIGWSLSSPAITRKTDKGLPQYLDSEESDVFILSGAEDLVPVLTKDREHNWVPDEFERDGYTVKRYRPRIEGLFARIERWTRLDDGDSHWRSLSRDNVLTVYGSTTESRIADPREPRRIFSWPICQSYDDKGNAIVYEYLAENDHGVDLARANERKRVRTANRYLQRIRYGNRTPVLIDTAMPSFRKPHTAVHDLDAVNWMFEVVFDYGDGHYREEPPDRDTRVFAEATATREPDAAWPVRKDPVSTYRAGFEVRTYRLCRRVLMFHHFPDELGTADYLVRATEVAYHEKPIGSFITRVVQSGYKRQSDGRYLKRSLQALELNYTSSPLEDPDYDGYQVKDVDPTSLTNLPGGIDGERYRWLDLDGEGISGVLSEQGDAWFYKPNLGDGHLGATQVAPTKPSLSALNSGRQQFLDVAGDGNLDLVQFGRSTPGFYERTVDAGWANFRPFPSLPVRDWNEPNLKFIDVTGNGLADVLITEGEAFTWHPSLLQEGFGAAIRVHVPYDEERGPRVLFADGTQSIYLADMSGDGLSDIVRIRNGEVCYWPNLGYGRFGAKVTMDQSPWFDDADLFDERLIRLADTDGSGTADVLYLGRDGVRIFLNEAGNGWSDARVLRRFPATDNLSSVTAVDFLGRGTACLLWSSPLPGDARRLLRYVDLMGGQKPHLLTRVRNNLGAETVIEYASSTEFYLADKAARKPWITRLPFPVHVVKRVETFDRVGRNRFVTSYAYHHGYFDGIEREFRGFGMVEQRDTEELGALTQSRTLPNATNIDAAYYVPPVLTKTWFHTGAYPDGAHVSRVFHEEYYRESDMPEGVRGLIDAESGAMVLPDTVLLPDLTGGEIREALRSLKGAILRQEVYALDGTKAANRPFTVSEHNYTIRRLQPFGGNRHAVFFTHARESIDFHYERKLYDVGGRKLADPRVTHSMILAVDDYGNELQSVAVTHGRRHDDPDPLLTAEDRATQRKIHVTSTESAYTNPILVADAYRAPLAAETRTYELIKIMPDRNMLDVTNLFGFDEMVRKVAQAGDGQHDLPYEDLYATGVTANHPYRRLIEQTRMLYRKDDLTGALPLGTLGSLALPFESYKLTFTPGLLPLYRRAQKSLLSNPASVLRDEGGYVLGDDKKTLGLFPASDAAGYWWIPSGRVFFSSDGAETAPQELAGAQAHFFVPRRFSDPFGNDATVRYDTHDLLVLETVDALQNKVTVGERASDGSVTNRNDYRVLQPMLLTDPNGNRSEVAFDAMGLVAGSAVKGKTTENLGDSLSGFVADLTRQDVDEFFANPKGPSAATLLANASTRIVYDLDRFASSGKPVFAAPIVRETHASDLGPGQTSKLQVSVSYSDGFGREIQKKIQAEPGPLVDGGPVVNPRWVGSGWTIFNNKGEPVRQYESFFDDTHDFKFGNQVGVSLILFYDPVGRVVATLHPNHTWEKVVFDPWRQASWDVNDTVLIDDPKTDDDVAPYFQRLPDADYLPAWHAARVSGALGLDEKAAAQKTELDAETPTIAFFDTQGRTFLSLAANGKRVADHYRTVVELDIEGNQRAVTDAQGRVVMRYDYDMLGKRIRQASMDAGERLMLNDVMGSPIRAWDSRGHAFRTEYDELRRPLRSYVTGADPQNPTREILYARTVYGEGLGAVLNHRGRVYQAFDGAGVVTNEAYDFKGNLLLSARQLVRDYKNTPDWLQSPPLEDETFRSRTVFDALNRPIQLIASHSDRPGAKLDVIRPGYSEANLLARVDAWLQQSTEPALLLDPQTANLHAVTNIDHNAKGQRERIDYGNGATTKHAYDPYTFRLIELKTTRQGDGAVMQELSYVYDPVGNITSIRDDAQQTIYFNNTVVEPRAEYTYDAIYRLINATGREHIGQLTQPQTTWNDASRVNLPLPQDAQALRRYNEAYQYDEVGNILHLIHLATNGSWARDYAYREPSLIESGQVNNRLTGTTVGATTETYAFDSHGNMTSMPHLMLMQWDFKDQLTATSGQVVHDQPPPDKVPETTFYVYDTSGQRVRKVTVRQNGSRKTERVYLGGFEIYREFNGNGTDVKLERETLHIMDDKQRIALIETRTQGDDRSPVQLIRFQFSNHLSSAILELNEQANVIFYEEYYPYGSTSYQGVRSRTETPKRYRYTGKERDEETGLYYHGARYYAAWLGRWNNPDPALLIDGPNPYRYVSGNPMKLTDPTGMWPTLEDVNRNLDRAGRYGAIMMGPTGIAARSLGKAVGGVIGSYIVDRIKGTDTGNQKAEQLADDLITSNIPVVGTVQAVRGGATEVAESVTKAKEARTQGDLLGAGGHYVDAGLAGLETITLVAGDVVAHAHAPSKIYAKAVEPKTPKLVVTAAEPKSLSAGSPPVPAAAPTAAPDVKPDVYTHELFRSKTKGPAHGSTSRGYDRRSQVHQETLERAQRHWGLPGPVPEIEDLDLGHRGTPLSRLRPEQQTTLQADPQGLNRSRGAAVEKPERNLFKQRSLQQGLDPHDPANPLYVRPPVPKK